ncbi:GNAT family N-acetyltransferase [Staphylococcus sp. SQ8-PEA]|uniref:GNAT family N-acetyltransferase n=1 Tax=Staphylococcus marylandisciuri TaxID=2981529 RepID=A0ABT2QP73_9STAP|nr:GNAT family N-acetyltransferase [Staphylococcus marylandisciuri]MCU5745774.1 GNAT family N-acetyltransferase [Staphylococcus marylandisciuri]
MRRLGLKDTRIIKEVSQLIERELSLQCERYHYTEFTIAAREEKIRRFFTYYHDLVLVEERDDELIGVIWAHFDKGNRTVNIEFLWVAPLHRKCGYGARLKREVEKWGKDQQAVALTSTVNVQNDSMLALNRKLGYETEQVIMRKKL